MFHFLIIGAFLKCAIAKVGFEKNNISQGFEALARAQCLLRSKISLGKMMLLSQVTIGFIVGLDPRFAFARFFSGQINNNFTLKIICFLI